MTPYDFFCCGSTIVSFHTAKGRPVHAVFIIFSASTEMCSASWYRWSFFTVVVFGVFSFNSRLSGRWYAIAKSTVALIFLLCIFSELSYFWCSCASEKCGIAIMVSVCVCVSAFLHRASIITVNFSVILFLIFFNSEMKKINSAKKKLRKTNQWNKFTGRMM